MTAKAFQDNLPPGAAARRLAPDALEIKLKTWDMMLLREQELTPEQTTKLAAALEAHAAALRAYARAVRKG